MLKLYDHPLSGNSYKVRLTLSHLGVEYERINIDIFEGEQNSPEFAALNPNKKIPVIEDGDFVMWESNAIPLYLGKKYSPNEIFPEDPEAFGLMTQWVLFGKTTLDPNLAMARFLTRFIPPEKRDERQIEQFREKGKAGLQILDNYLNKNNFLAGGYSIADICCFPYVSLSEEGGVSLGGYPSVISWCERIKSRPGYIPM